MRDFGSAGWEAEETQFPLKFLRGVRRESEEECELGVSDGEWLGMVRSVLEEPICPLTKEDKESANMALRRAVRRGCGAERDTEWRTQRRGFCELMGLRTLKPDVWVLVRKKEEEVA